MTDELLRQSRRAHGRHQLAPDAGMSMYEAASFAALGLTEPILAAVDEMGFAEPTPVQAQVIPAVLAGRDVLAEAETGSGKTCAFVLPTLCSLTAHKAKTAPRLLVVTPTRELASQIAEVASTVCARTGHAVGVVVGGVGYEGQRTALADGIDMLVATPGRLVDLMSEGTADLTHVQVLVLDEADRMLDMGFLPQVRQIVEACTGRCQTLLFSATLSQGVLDHIGGVVVDPVQVEIAPAGFVTDAVDQYVLGVSAEAKKRTLVEVLRREGSQRVICFCRGKHRADHLSRVLNKKGFVAAPIHGDRTQNQRMRALERFRAGEVGVLVATDVLARGIDVAEVAYVVNIDVPHEAQDYVHRIGRTGRAGRRGFALTFVSAEEKDDLLSIERLMGCAIKAYPDTDGIDVGQNPAQLEEGRNPLASVPARKTSRRRRRTGKTHAATKVAENAQDIEAVKAADGGEYHRRRGGRRGGNAMRKMRRAPEGASRTRG